MLKGVFVFIGLQQATSVNDFTNTCGHVLLTLHITLPKPSAISRQNLEVRASHCAALSHQNDNNIAWGQPHWSAIFAVVATSLRAHYSMHVYSDRAAHVVAVAPAAHAPISSQSKESCTCFGCSCSWHDSRHFACSVFKGALRMYSQLMVK